MKQNMKCYLVFTTPLYRLCIFVLLPAALLLLPLLWPVKDYLLLSYVGTGLSVCMGIGADYWVFGGIARRDGQLEYLKSSGRGPAMIRTALVVHLIRLLAARVLLLASYYIICRLYNIEAACDFDFFAQTLEVLLVGYFYTVAGMTVVRFLDAFPMTMTVSMICTWLTGLTFLAGTLNRWLVLVPAAPFCAAVSVLGVWLVMKKVKESYYDKKD